VIRLKLKYIEEAHIIRVKEGAAAGQRTGPRAGWVRGAYDLLANRSRFSCTYGSYVLITAALLATLRRTDAQTWQDFPLSRPRDRRSRFVPPPGTHSRVAPPACPSSASVLPQSCCR
jgi:hypothetical protein